MEHRLIGKRIKLLQMYDPNPIPVGTQGTITFVNPTGMRFTQIGVKWDNGSMLMLSVPPDKYELVDLRAGAERAQSEQVKGTI